MSQTAPGFLVTRTEDLVVLGVGWSGMRVAATGNGPTVLEATSDEAVVTLHFPPQHVAEQVLREGSSPDVVDGARVFRARLAGPSQVSVQMRRGQRVTLTVDGLLAALAGAPAVGGTAIELPYRVVLAPGSGGFTHPSTAVTSPAGTTGLWQTALAPVPLPVTPLSIVDAEDPFPLALTQGDRRSIDNGGSPLRADCERLELSALGGSLTAHATSGSFDWDQRVAVGRDVHVRTATALRLYPFNHRAVYVQTSDRVFDAKGPDQAALKQDSRLVILDRVVDLPAADPGNRQFPFHRVEILDSVLPQVAPPQWTVKTRDSQLLGPLGQQRQEVVDRRDALLVDLDPAIHQPRTEQELQDEGFPPLAELGVVGGQIDDIEQQLAQIKEDMVAADRVFDQIAALQRQIDRLQMNPVGPGGRVDPSDQQQIDQLNQQIADLRMTVVDVNPQFVATLGRQKADLERQAKALRREVDAELMRPRSVQELADAGNAEAQAVLDLEATIADLDQQIAEQKAGERTPTNWFFVPSDSHGQPVPFSLRLHGSAGAVTVSMPLVAVNDVSLPAIPGFAEFDPLADRSTEDIVAETWRRAGAGVVALPPAPVDLIRSAQPRPGDVHEIRGLNIEGVLAGGGFRPVLRSFEVGLPALRTLAGDAAPATLAFTTEFLANGDTEDLAFALLNEAGRDISFVRKADRSGGLVSPRILADGISRSFGPIVSAAVREKVGDRYDMRKLLADGATILGFDLRELVGSVDTPPAIVAELSPAGMPVVRMRWANVPLHGDGSTFVAGQGATFDLDVEASPARTVTTCTVRDFSLSLPDQHDELLRVGFDAVTFTQQPGQPPRLAITGLRMDFVGKLALLQVLQDAVGLGDAAPTVDASPTGIMASYAVPVPEVALGSFVMRDILFRAGIDVPFTGDPVVVTIGFASRQRPFTLTVLSFGGGGYVQAEIDHGGLRSIEAALEFGAAVAVNFVVASGEVHAMGGIGYARLPDGSVRLSGYLRFGGSVEVLGLVSVSVEIRVELDYDADTNELAGEATLVLDIDLTLYSHEVKLDSGRWVISGGHSRFAAQPEDAVAVWQRYRKAFA
jgi:hypothetical protein